MSDLKIHLKRFNESIRSFRFLFRFTWNRIPTLAGTLYEYKSGERALERFPILSALNNIAGMIARRE